MVENRLKECCTNCNHIDCEANEVHMLTGIGDKINRSIEIYCKHEDVCYKYRESK